jgi:hypothetical protein
MGVLKFENSHLFLRRNFMKTLIYHFDESELVKDKEYYNIIREMILEEMYLFTNDMKMNTDSAINSIAKHYNVSQKTILYLLKNTRYFEEIEINAENILIKSIKKTMILYPHLSFIDICRSIANIDSSNIKILKRIMRKYIFNDGTEFHQMIVDSLKKDGYKGMLNINQEINFDCDIMIV